MMVPNLVWIPDSMYFVTYFYSVICILSQAQQILKKDLLCKLNDDDTLKEQFDNIDLTVFKV